MPGAKPLAARWCKGQEETLGVLEHTDSCIDLQDRPQLDIHDAHHVVFLEQQQSLPINFP